MCVCVCGGGGGGGGGGGVVNSWKDYIDTIAKCSIALVIIVKELAPM